MIVPRNRLLFWVAIVVLPFSLLVGIEPSARLLAWGAIFTFGLVTALDAVAARKRLAGIAVELHPVTRMSKDREGRLEVRIRNDRRRETRLRLALTLPPEVVSPQEDLSVTLPGEVEWSRLDWTCVPQKRGNYRLREAHLETASPLGFWSARRSMAGAAELRVYPNLFRERRDLAGLFLHRGTFGFHARRQIGKGREFEKLREYSPGDSFDEIHWKATARRGRPITKVFQIERTQEVYVVIDASRLSSRPISVPAKRVPAAVPEGSSSAATLAPTTTTLERFITAALLLGLAAEQQGDFFGLLTFSDQVGRFVRAKNGKAHYNTCRDALYTLEPSMVSPDYDEVCTFMRLRLRRRALLIFLTALDDPVIAESFVKNIDLIRRQHLVLVNMLQPPGVAPLFSSPDVSSVDDLYDHLGGHLQWHKLRELEKVLQRRGVRFSLLKNERLSAQLAAQYLEVKRRQLL
jgi:uncharacterized protein (DUF58 family)